MVGGREVGMSQVRRATIMALQGIIEQDERNLKLANMLLAHLEDSDPSVRAAAVRMQASAAEKS